MTPLLATLFTEAVPNEDGLFVYEGRHPLDRTMYVSAIYDPKGNVLAQRVNEGRITDTEYVIALYDYQQSQKKLAVRIR